MSYVRWSTPVRPGCLICGDELLRYYREVDRQIRHGSTGTATMGSFPDLCRACTSCWYVYANVGGYISLHHAGCHGDCPPLDLSLDYEDAAEWWPPQECEMGDVALRAVQAAYHDWIEGGRE